MNVLFLDLQYQSVVLLVSGTPEIHIVRSKTLKLINPFSLNSHQIYIVVGERTLFILKDIGLDLQGLAIMHGNF